MDFYFVMDATVLLGNPLKPTRSLYFAGNDAGGLHSWRRSLEQSARGADDILSVGPRPGRANVVQYPLAR